MRDGCFVIEGGALICLSVMGRLGLDLSGAHLKFASVMSWKNCSRWCCRDLGGGWYEFDSMFIAADVDGDFSVNE